MRWHRNLAMLRCESDRRHVPALAQVLQHADVAFFFGMIDTQQRIDAMTMQLQISQLIADGAQSLHLSTVIKPLRVELTWVRQL